MTEYHPESGWTDDGEDTLAENFLVDIHFSGLNAYAWGAGRR